MVVEVETERYLVPRPAGEVSVRVRVELRLGELLVIPDVQGDDHGVRLENERRGRDLNPRRTFQHVRDFQSRSLGHSDTSPYCEAEKEGFEPSMEAFTPITP
jgi:hypothetical protein